MPDLPRIVRFLETRDCPESSCPHCGANGRYILTFQVEDGRTLGAMRGCVKLFPVPPVALEELRLRTKAADYAKKGWSLNYRDGIALEAIEAFYAGTRTERDVMGYIRSVKAANQARWR
jgi:hypothetical protein